MKRALNVAKVRQQTFYFHKVYRRNESSIHRTKVVQTGTFK